MERFHKFELGVSLIVVLLILIIVAAVIIALNNDRLLNNRLYNVEMKIQMYEDSMHYGSPIR